MRGGAGSTKGISLLVEVSRHLSKDTISFKQCCESLMIYSGSGIGNDVFRVPDANPTHVI